MRELHIETAGLQRDLRVDPFHRWKDAEEADWCCFYRIDESFVLRFPNLMDFSIDARSLEINCKPVPGVSSTTINQLYLNQVLPLIQSHSGELVFHGSSVVIDDVALAFMGVSGRGKSTLAASFSSNSYQFMTDDGMLIKPTDNGYLVFPSHPSIRLWEDSEAAILGVGAESAPPLEYTSKLRFPASEKIVHYDRPCPLHRAYFLGDTETSETSFTKLSPQQAMVELIKHSFILDVEDRKIMSAHFDAISKMSALDIFYRLDYPRSYDVLSNVRHAILEHAGLSDKKLVSNA